MKFEFAWQNKTTKRFFQSQDTSPRRDIAMSIAEFLKARSLDKNKDWILHFRILEE